MANLGDFLAWLRPTADPDEKHGAELLEQFYSTLRVIYLAARQNTRGASPDTEIDQKVRQLLEDRPSWRSAYEIEQLLSLLMTEEQLNAELPRRLEEAKKLELTYVSKLEEMATQQTGIATRRSLYQRLLNDLQWFYSQRIQRRAASRKLAVRVSALFLLAFFAFFLIIAIQFFAQPGIPIKTAGGGSDNALSGQSVDQAMPLRQNEGEGVR